MHDRVSRGIIVSAVLVVATSGMCGCHNPCSWSEAKKPAGLVYVFPGVAGGAFSMRGACRALDDAGIPSAVKVHEWGRSLDLFGNLMREKRNRRVAADVAGQITAYREEHEDAPIDLVGYSGGGGFALFVTEVLPEHVRIRNIVLAQPAVSPSYDLGPALRHVDGKLVNHYSQYDFLILGLGTFVFGTMDREHTSSAGMKGFTVEEAVNDPALRQRVEQHRWTCRSILEGHLGDHFGILGARWNADHVAPYLR